MKLIVGLGNPGDKYAETRHNIGFRVAKHLAERAGITLKKSGYQGIYGVGRMAGEDVTILLPQTFMNKSGASVGSACKSLGVEPGDLIVVHDDIDLPFGVLKIKDGGGHGGQNGIRHIKEVLCTGEFIRVKVGIGRPRENADVSDHVLSRFSAAERKSLENLLMGACEAVEKIIASSVQEAMNAYNNSDFS